MELERIYKTTSGMFDKDVFIKPYAVLDLAQSIAGRHAYLMHIGADELLKQNLGWIIARQTYVFYNTPFLFDDLRIVTFPHPKGRYEYLREYECYNGKNELVFRGISLWVLLDFTTNRLVNKDIYPEGDYRTDSHFDKVDKPIIVSNNINKCGSHIVVKSDLDMYNHLNNAKYADIIFDYAGLDAKDYGSLTISYQRQAVLNDVIDIYKEEIDNKINISGYINNNICFSSTIIRKE